MKSHYLNDPPKMVHRSTTTQWLHENFGGNIHCLQDTPNKGKMPDALWNGIYWEYKAPSTEGAVKDRIKSARRQIAERLKLDGRDENEKRGFVIDISNRKKQGMLWLI